MNRYYNPNWKPKGEWNAGIKCKVCHKWINKEKEAMIVEGYSGRIHEKCYGEGER